jgi:hypothetical protein
MNVDPVPLPCMLEVTHTQSTVPNPRGLTLVGAADTVVIASESQLQLLSKSGNSFGSSMFDAGAFPIAAAAGDFDEDGRLDLAIANSPSTGEPPSISILRGQENGAFTASAQTIAVSTARLIAANLTGDSHLDLLASSPDGVQVLTGTGNATFSALPEWSLGGEARHIELADVDGDGHLDVIALAPFDLVVRTSSTSSTTMYDVGGIYPRDVAVGDLDNDGDIDLAVANADIDAVRIFLNTNGSFSTSFDLATDIPDGSDGAPTGSGSGSNLGAWVPRDIAIADLTGDGASDVLVLIEPYGPSDNTSLLLVLERTTGHDFVARQCSMSMRPVDLKTGNFLGDPRTDVLILAAPYDASGGGRVMVLQQTP